jgi:hypothetical protein
VHEHILAAAFRGDKAEALCFVEPFHGAFGHRDVSCLKVRPHNVAAWHVSLESSCCGRKTEMQWSIEITSHPVLTVNPTRNQGTWRI